MGALLDGQKSAVFAINAPSLTVIAYQIEELLASLDPDDEKLSEAFDAIKVRAVMVPDKKSAMPGAKKHTGYAASVAIERTIV